MRRLTFGIVAEGPTDVELIIQLIQHVIPGEHRFLPLQPDISGTPGFGAYGGGWRGVFAWCRSFDSKEELHHVMQGISVPVDYLIIHVDADISREADINCAMPCPDAEDTVRNIELLLKEALKIKEVPDNIIFCVPSDCTEAWVLQAFNPGAYHDPPTILIECLKEPDDIISKPPHHLLKRKNDRPKKNQIIYREKLIPIVVRNWEDVVGACHQASKLNNKLLFIRDFTI